MAAPGLPLAPLHEALGAVFGTFQGWRVPRHYGDPGAEYRAATEGVGVADRSFRGRFLVGGRAPAAMLQGLLTNDVRRPGAVREDGVVAGRGVYAAVLTPKGKMITDLRLFWRGAREEDGLLLDVPAAGAEGLRAHFARVLPPRFARLRDRTAETGAVALVGPEAARVVAGSLPGAVLPEDELLALEEDGFRVVPRGGAELLVARSGEVGVPAFDVAGPREEVGRIWEAALAAGARPLGREAWDTLRVEAGRPLFGVDMDGGTIPLEAGIEERAIDHGKGCYTGQEVVVRIRDRGHVNRHLRRVLLGQGPLPGPGAELFPPGRDRPVGRITSAVSSPRHGEGLGLAYVRREVRPPAVLRLAGPRGRKVRVREL